MRIVVGGYIGLLPAGGVTWDYIQYVLGFQRMGHDVFYIEDTSLWPVFQDIPESGPSCATNVEYLDKTMRDLGLQDRWAYRDELTGQWFGMSASRASEVVASADIFVNISCANAVRPEHANIPVRILIDSDPMFTQVQHRDSLAFFGAPGMREMVAAHTHHFSFGESLGRPDCRVPDCGVTWQPTRQPVCTWLWPETPQPAGKPRFTTVMNWTAARQFEFDGEKWGQKDIEFRKLMGVPNRIPSVSLEVAVTQTNTGESGFPTAMANANGWTVVDPHEKVPTTAAYQSYLRESSGEFSVAKEAYVKARTGWFSCRSACYLATGRPVVTQDTGWSEHIPAGEGLFAFHDEETALDGLRRAASDLKRHSAAAAAVAREYFDSDKVLGSMLARVS